MFTVLGTNIPFEISYRVFITLCLSICCTRSNEYGNSGGGGMVESYRRRVLLKFFFTTLLMHHHPMAWNCN